MERVVKIQVVDPGDLVEPVSVTNKVTRGDDGQRMTFKSNRKTVIILKGNKSPFVGLPPNKNLLVYPAKTLKLKSGLRRKKYKFLCGHFVNGEFKPWGGGGFETPPIP